MSQDEGFAITRYVHVCELTGEKHDTWFIHFLPSGRLMAATHNLAQACRILLKFSEKTGRERILDEMVRGAEDCGAYDMDPIDNPDSGSIVDS